MPPKLSRFFLYVFVLGIAAWTLVPIVWMVLASFKPNAAIYTDQPKWVFSPTTEHYAGLLTEGDSLVSHLTNSLLAAGISTLASLVLGVMAGYGLARGPFANNRHLSFWIISTRMAPIAAVIIPLYLLFSQLHLLYTLTGLILAYMTFNLPFARMESAAIQRGNEATGDIALSMAGPDRIAYLHLWPHVRPWRLKKTEPMLRSIEDAAAVGRLLADAWSRSRGIAVQSAPAAAAPRRHEPSALPVSGMPSPAHAMAATRQHA